MTLIKRWLNAATLIDEHTPPACSEETSRSYRECASELEDAITPRAPKLEWFDIWRHWWIVCKNGDEYLLRNTSWDDENGCVRMDSGAVWIDAIKGCVPVACKGFPAPVSWSVVEGER